MMEPNVYVLLAICMKMSVFQHAQADTMLIIKNVLLANILARIVFHQPTNVLLVSADILLTVLLTLVFAQINANMAKLNREPVVLELVEASSSIKIHVFLNVLGAIKIMDMVDALN